MVLHHRNKKLPDIFNIYINSIAIDRVSEFNFLGLIINENLSWKPHVNKIASKISKQIGVLNKLKHMVPNHILRMLYCSLILPHMSYCILSWGFELNRIAKLQKRAVRTITCSKFNSHTEPLFKKLNLLNLNDIFTVKSLSFYFKFVNGNIPGYFKDSFVFNHQRDVHSHNTRSSEFIPSNVTHTVFAQNCLRHALPRIINHTDQNIINKIYTHSPKGFINYAKKIFINNYSVTCQIRNCYSCNNAAP